MTNQYGNLIGLIPYFQSIQPKMMMTDRQMLKLRFYTQKQIKSEVNVKSALHIELLSCSIYRQIRLSKS